ncbi:MAG: hypothetical protein GX339_09620 [Tissierellia bacterium]|nr:hypothetical protein [Tissierellia bacterium]
MAKRRRMYSRRRRINYKPILFLAAIIVILIAVVLNIFKKDSYISKIDEALTEMSQMSGTISIVSKIDATIYEKDGLKYSNQHEGIKRLTSFDGKVSDDSSKVENVKSLLDSLLNSDETELVSELPSKDDGYLWLEADIISEHEILIFDREKEYNFDLYYHIEDEIIYLKEKYFDEFSKRYNKTNFQGYKATDEFISILKELTENQAGKREE